MQPTRSPRAAERGREEEKVKERTGKGQDEAETDETIQKCFVTLLESVM